MARFRFQGHGRIQEAIAEEQGYFARVGLDYEPVNHRLSVDTTTPLYARLTTTDAGPSAFREFALSAGSVNAASTSHWAVAAAISLGCGQMWPHAYSIMPAGIYVKPDSDVTRPEDLAKVEIVVGRHSGSHFSAAYALQNIVPRDDIRLKFVAGRAQRLEYLLDSGAEAGSVYGVESYVLEQHGFRKIVDTSFIVSFMIVGSPEPDDVSRYFDALRLAQRAIDENPGPYKHHLLHEIPERLRAAVNVQGLGIGERLIFDAYPAETFERAKHWIFGERLLPAEWTGLRTS